MPGDSTPPSRFVKMAFLTQSATKTPKAIDAMVMTNHILSNVFITSGLVRGDKNTNESFETTQWTVFKDLNNNIMYFKTYNYPTLRSINFNNIALKEGSKPVKISVDIPAKISEEVSKQLK